MPYDKRRGCEMERAKDCACAVVRGCQLPVAPNRSAIGPSSWEWISLLALCAIVLPAASSAQVAARLVGKIEERQLDVRPDSGGQLIGLIQGEAGTSQNIAQLSGLLPARKAPMTVCLKARQPRWHLLRQRRAFSPGWRRANAEGGGAGLPEGRHREGPAPTTSGGSGGDVRRPTLRPPDVFRIPGVARPCRQHDYGHADLGDLLEDPEARLTPEGKTRPEIAGTCRRLPGRSLSFNVLCEFAARIATISKTAPAFSAVLRTYRRALAAGDGMLADGLISWLAGQPNVAASVKRAAGIKGDLDHFGATNFLVGLLTILRDSGFPGLVMVLDEVETLQRMRTDTREKGLNCSYRLNSSQFEEGVPV